MMNKEQIEHAFTGRWHMKVENTMSAVGLADGVKELCYDFFTAGCLLNELSEEVEITPVDFENWWNSYDKKIGKEKAKKLWEKLSKKEKRDCMEYTPAYVASTSEKRFRKNPETFLRNKSWNDEIIIRNEHRQLTAADLAEKAARILQD